MGIRRTRTRGNRHWATKHEHTVATTLLFETTLLPNQEAFDWLVVPGGPMGVYDDKDYSWLTAEKDFLRESIAARKTIIGICLSAQLLADALGARVQRNPHKEIRWFALELTEEGRHYGPMSFPPRIWTNLAQPSKSALKSVSRTGTVWLARYAPATRPIRFA